MNPHCEMKDADWDSLALGGLAPTEAKPLLAHLNTGCRVCGALYGEALIACQALGVGLAGQAPSQVVEDRLASYVKHSGKVVEIPRSRWQTWVPWGIAAASLVMAAWVGVPREGLKSEPIVKVEKQVVDPNPALELRVAQLEAALKSRPEVKPQVVVEVAADPRVAELTQKLEAAERRLAAPPQVVKVEDPDKDRQLGLFRAQVKQLEIQLAEAQAAQREKVQQLNVRLASLDLETKTQRRALDDYRNAFRTIESTGMRQVEMAVVDAAAGRSSARALYSQQGGLLVVAHDLPKLPQQHCYQVWILRKGSPSIVSGGLMKLDERGHGYLQSPATAALKDATGFAITDEPPGGSVVARGRKLLFGAL